MPAYLMNLLPSKFVFKNWEQSGINVASAVKRGLYTIHQNLILKKVGHFTQKDRPTLILFLRNWLNLM